MRLLLAGVAALALSGCADSSRLDDPFGNPFHGSKRYDRTPTGTVNAPEKKDFFSETFKTFDDGASRPDAPPRYQSRPAPVSMNRADPIPPAPIVSSPISSTPLSAPRVSSRPAVSAPVQAAISTPRVAPVATPRVAAARVGGWSIDGGAPVVVAQGETAGMIANRYGVPVETLLTLNGYRTASQVQPGSRLTIPVYSANRSAQAQPQPAAEAPRLRGVAEVAPAKVQPQPRYAMTTGAKSQVETEEEEAAVAPQKPAADPLAARKAKLAEARAAAMKEAAAETERKRTETAQAQKLALKAQKDQAKAEKLAQAQAAAQAKAAQAKVALAEPAPAPVQEAVKVEKQARVAAPQEDATARTAPEPTSAVDSANPEFRWPARGRVIQAYGNGGNDGINIAVPEGTAVKAAESGIVTYAGSELKGYGNLVLIHHPNGFDSVYANNGSINVKRGDTVKRGQVIALSGQSGNVASPQLHFELRKGHKPVDPSSFLAGL